MIKKDNNSISSVYNETTVIGKIYAGILKVYESWRKLFISGIPPLTLLKCKASNLLDYKIYGNSVQNGTPTPDNPIEIESVGERTKNLINKIKLGHYNTNGVYESRKDRCCTDVLKVKSNTTYTLSFLGSKTAVICFYDIDGNLLSRTNLTNMTFTTSDATDTISIFWYTISEISDIDNVQLEEGAIASDYEPYGYKIPVKIRGKNLNSGMEFGNISSSGNLVTNTVQLRSKYYISVNPGETYTVSSDMGYKFAMYGFGSDKTFVKQIIQDSIVNDYWTFTIPTNVFYVKIKTSSWQNDIEAKIQMEYGTATDYEEYVEPITTNIYLDEPLRKIGDYADYIDFENKKVIRNISKIDLGTKGWIMPSGYSGYMYYSGKIDNMNYKNPNIPLGLCTHYSINSVYGGWAVSDAFEGLTINWNTGALGLKDMRFFEDASGLINALTGVYLYYVLTEEKTETIDLPNILIHKGTNIIEIDTTITPSNMEVTYLGKK